jgi:hypothetical protein
VGSLAAGDPTGTVSSSIIADVQACSVLGVHGTDAAGAFVQINPNANGVYQTADNAAAAITTLCFQMMAIIPLAMLSQFFRELPMLGSLSQMELRLQLNISQSNLWSATYAAPAAGTNIHIPASTSASQSVGDTCPFLLTNPATAAGLGMRVVGNTPTFTVTSNVGFYNSMPAGNLVAYGSGYRVSALPSIGTSLWIPSVSLTDPMREALLHKRTKTILYNDFQSDFTLQNIQPGARVQRLLT